MEKPEATAQLVKDEIYSSIFLLESLKKGIINYSELARQLLPKIKEQNKKANISSIIISLQRLYEEIKNEKRENSFKEILENSELIMKTNIVDLTLERTKEVTKIVSEISKEIKWDIGDVMFIIQGTSEITVILDKKNLKKFDRVRGKIIEIKENLAMLSLREPEDLSSYSKGVVGFLAFLTSALSDKNINIWEAATTYKQNIFIISEEDLPKAYEILKKLIDHYKSPLKNNKN
jgi:hypothetical protein